MQRVELSVDVRKDAGKGVARQLRRQAKLPGVLYHRGSSVSIVVDERTMTRLLRSGAGENALISLKIQEGGKSRSCIAIVRDHQNDPITNRLLHVDLFEISMDKPIQVTVHVGISGEVPVGVKEGGIIQHHLREVEVECLPASIPDEITVDASQLQINQALHISDLVVESGVHLMLPLEQVVVSIAAPISDAKLEEMLTATAKEAKEPEMVKKEKKEEDAEAGDEAKPAEPEEEKAG